MSSRDLSVAFESLEARARADAGADPRDRISLRDHVVKVEIGAFQSERGTTQRVSFSIVVEVKPQADRVDDDVDRILSYDTITAAIATELAAERLNLLETLAERIAERILDEPQAARVFVRIEKLDRGPGALGVEIVRSREALPGGRAVSHEEPHPLVILLSRAALGHANLTAWVDQIAQWKQPVVICVEPDLSLVPEARHAAVQKRIDLLAMEQAAWLLAAKEARCIVIATRTEMDHAAQAGEIAVWAPSKLVLDAVETPKAGPREVADLVAWLADELEATGVLTIGQPDRFDGIFHPVDKAALDLDKATGRK